MDGLKKSKDEDEGSVDYISPRKQNTLNYELMEVDSESMILRPSPKIGVRRN